MKGKSYQLILRKVNEELSNGPVIRDPALKGLIQSLMIKNYLQADEILALKNTVGKIDGNVLNLLIFHNGEKKLKLLNPITNKIVRRVGFKVETDESNLVTDD